MKELKIGRRLVEHRYRRGITQDELAEFMGVSKASVSKWETASTYPDITLLPRLAAFFNISIDELIGYEPQMEKEDIRRLYRQLSRDFFGKPFDEVMDSCRKLVKNYYSCAPLLFQLGSLYVNHCMLAGSPEKVAGVLEEAVSLFTRIRSECDDISLQTQALYMEAFCHLKLGRADETHRLLSASPVFRMAAEPLLACSYQMMGDLREAKRVLQAGIYQTVIELLNLLNSYTELCGEDIDAFEETCGRLLAIAESFHLKELHPGILLSLYLSIAQGYVRYGKNEKALEILMLYTALARSAIYPLCLHGDAYFDLLDSWLEENLILGNALPRDEAVMQKSIVEALDGNPAFSPISDNVQFKHMIRQLKTAVEVSS